MSSAVLNLVTGVNGAGKTLFLLPHVEEVRKASITPERPEGRPVYYWGIPGIKEKGVLNWIELEPVDETGLELEMKDPMAVHKLPEGSIIVIDEAHAVVPAGGKEPPEHVTAFATSRWRGHTVFFCTQHGSSLHTFIRKRVNKHHHMIRAFGMERSTRLEWERYADETSSKDRKEAQAHEFRYPKEVYGWYRSSAQHVVKKTIPWKKLAIFAWAPPALALLVWFVWSRLDPTEEPKAGSSPDVAEGLAVEPRIVKPAIFDAKADATRWASQFAERIEGVPYSAQAYDASFKVKAHPRISGCAEIKYREGYSCRCNTQQGTIIRSMSLEQCRAWIAFGMFDPSQPDRAEEGQKATTTADSSSALPAILK